MLLELRIGAFVVCVAIAMSPVRGQESCHPEWKYLYAGPKNVVHDAPPCPPGENLKARKRANFN
jgi:hypothetical protein